MSDQESNKPSSKPVILVVDDSKVIRKAAVKMLGDDYVVKEAADGEEGWQLIQQRNDISVVFTDMQMPIMGGMELLKKIRDVDDEHISSIPVIIITGKDDTEELKRDVFDAGATDFITKPFGSIDLLSRAKSYAQLNRKVVELEKQTAHDLLTGLLNTASLEEQGDKSLSFACRHLLNISTVYFEIDGFQELFLKNGKTIAQQIIVAVGKRIAKELRTEDIAARVGVAKFAVLLPMTNATHTRIVVSRVREAINKLVFDTGKEKIRIVLAAGMTSLEARGEMKYLTLMDQADTALKRAIEKTGDKVATYLTDEEKVDEIITLEPSVTDEELQTAFKHILEGDYFKIDRAHLRTLTDRLTDFFDYAETQEKEDLTGTDH